MRKLAMLCAAAALMLAMAGCQEGERGFEEDDRSGGAPLGRQMQGQAGQQAIPVTFPGQEEDTVKLTPQQAEQIATQRVAGQVQDTNLLREPDGQLAYAVTIHVQNEPQALNHTVFVNPDNGNVLRVEDRSMLGPNAVTVPEDRARAAALSQRGGEVSGVAVLNLDGRAVYQFEIATPDGADLLVYVDGNTGELVKSQELVALEEGKQPSQQPGQGSQTPQPGQPGYDGRAPKPGLQNPPSQQPPAPPAQPPAGEQTPAEPGAG